MKKTKSAAHEQIIKAIKKRKTLLFFYYDLLRVVEPYCYGLGKDGQFLLRAFQIDGKSATKPLPGWRLFRVEKMKETQATDTYFSEFRSDFDPADPAIKAMLYRLEKE